MTAKKTIKIRSASSSDMPTVHKLVMELAVFEKAPNEVVTTVREYEQDFKNGWFDILLATEDENVVGMALFNKAYSTWKGAMIYLEDLIVIESHRGQGIGRLLLDELYEKSRQMGAKLVKWQVLDWNVDAIAFYKKDGVKLEDEWINCKKFL